MAYDEPSSQLLLELRGSVQASLKSRRPILHHLNADTSWLLQIPRPESAVRHGARFYYNILIDPWLVGGQSDVASWFSQQWHASPSAVGTIGEIDELARDIEILADGLRLGKGRKSNTQLELKNGWTDSLIDAVAISHEFTDHCHKDTLVTIHPNVPVFATSEAAKLVGGWGHFNTVVTVPVFSEDGDVDWRSTSIPPLPDWVGIGRLLSRRDALEYHSALLITFNSLHASHATKLSRTEEHKSNARRNGHHAAIEPNEDEETAEAVIYTPHGIMADDVEIIAKAEPRIRTLAFLHGLHDVRLSRAQLNLGAHNGLRAQRSLKARYWIGTHDEVKTAGGLIKWFLYRDVISLRDALEREKNGHRGSHTHEEQIVLDSFDGTCWEELGNGESRVLY